MRQRCPRVSLTLNPGYVPTCWRTNGRNIMRPRHRFIGAALLMATILAAPAFAADVTPQRLLNPDNEPQNSLMNHRTYDGQRLSPLARINPDNVKGLRLAYSVPLGRSAR